MDEIFVPDVWEIIFQQCDTYVLGRISLISKSAPKHTWSLAPCLKVLHNQGSPPSSWCPYSSSFRYASVSLREVVIESPQDCELILTHLDKHCPRLEKLAIKAELFRNLSPMVDRIAGILPRLSSFHVHVLAPLPVRVRDPYHQILRNIFQLIHVPLVLKELYLSFPLNEDQMEEFVDAVLSKVPSLRRLQAGIPLQIAHKVLPVLPKLEWIAINFPIDTRDAGAISEWCRPFFNAHLSVDVWANRSNGTLDLLNLFMERGFTANSILDTLTSFGLKRKISINGLRALLSYFGSHYGNFDLLLQRIISNHYPLLPSRDELVPHASSIFATMAWALSPESIRLFVETFGQVKSDPFEILPRIFQAFYLAPLPSIDRAECLLELKIIDAAALTVSDPERGNLFSHLRSIFAFDWLASKMAPSDVLRLLRQRPSTDACPAAKCLPDFFQKLKELSPSLLAFPEEQEFQ
eukprot:TRINITY_DN15042_c0_g1_i1.p1 TRINITY_DN15042_c0_g1~~TRINITY_DN15042_c0_g1_i1.p1  ORF type:complete len:465 (+),score=38.46 TRINITY_DN15042_c0_g1_i1:60-1454(+)